MTTTPIHVYKLGGYSVTLFSNRIEIITPAFLRNNTETILLKSITAVDMGLAKPLTVTTADGKKHQLKIGGSAAEEMRQAILTALP